MKNIYFLTNFLTRTISQSSTCEKVDNSSIIKKSAKRFLLPLIFLFVAFVGNGNLMGQCVITNTGTVANNDDCTTRSLFLGAGECRTLTVPAGGAFYNFSFSNNAQSNGYCVNGTQYTGGTTIFLGANATICIFRSNGTWSATSATLNYGKTVPTLTANSPTTATICVNGSVSISRGTTLTNGTATYWQGLTSGGTSTTNSSSPNSTGVIGATGVYTYYYRPFNGGCWGTQQATSVTVVADPVAPTIAKSPADATVCEGASLTVTPSGGSGGTGTCSNQYRYSTNNGGTWTAWSTVVPNFTAVTGTNLVQSRRNCTGSGCVSNINEVSWNVVANPIAPTITKSPNVAAVCEGATLTATTSGGSGGTGTCSNQYRHSTDNGASWSAWSTTIPSFTAVTGTNLIESRRDCSGIACESNINQVSWTVVADPIAPTIAKSPNVATVCENAVLTVTPSGGSGGTGTCNNEYRYSVNNGLSWTAWSTTVPSFAAEVGTNLVQSRRNCTGSGCDSNVNQVSWNVVADPVAPSISKSPNVANLCEGAELTVTTAGGSGGTGTCNNEYRFSTNNGTSWSAWSTTLPIFNAVVGTNLVQSRRNCTGSGCVSNVNDVSWNVVADPVAPTLTKSPNVATVCEGTNLSATSAGGSGGTGTCNNEYRYSTNNGVAWTAWSTTIPTFPAVVGTNIIQSRRSCTGIDCDSNIDEVTWSVVADPTAPTTATKNPNVTTVCESTTLSLSGAATGGNTGVNCDIEYRFSTDGGSTWTSTGTVVPSFPAAGTDNRIQARRANCQAGCTTTSWNTVATWTVQPQPTAPTTAPKSPDVATVCTSTSVSLSGPASGGTDAGCTIEYRYSTDGGATFSAASTTIPSSISSATAGTDRIQVEARRVSCNTGCSNTGWGLVASWNVLTQPTAPTTAPKSPDVATVCTNTNVGISGPATGGTNRACVINYRYSTDGGATWSGESTTLPTGLSSSVAGANRIQIQARRVDCTTTGCNDTPWNIVATWNVDPQPTAPTTATKIPDQPSICVSGTAGIDGPATGGADAGCDIEYRYSIDGGVFWSAPSTTIPTGISTTLLGTNIIRIDARRVDCLNPGCNDTGWNTIAAWSVVGEPTVASTGSDHGPICQTASVTLAANNPSVGTGSWSVVSGPSTSSAQFSNVLSTSSSFTPAGGGGTYVLRWTISNNPCTPSTSDVSVFVDGLPTASAGGLATICQNGAATVSGASATNGTIQWTHNGAGSLTNATTLTPTYNAAAGDAGNTVTLTMTVTSNNTCGAATATAFYSVNVESLPSASAGGSSTICPGDPATVSGASAANGNILWSHDGAGSLANATTLTPTYTSVLTDEGNVVTLTMTVTSNNACNPIDSTATYTVLVSGNSIAATGINASSTTVCANNEVVLTVDGGTLALGADWEWYDDVGLTNNIGSGSPISFYPTATTTYYVRAEGVCNTTAATDITITVQTGAGNAFLVTGNRPGAEEECLDGAWTYYSTSTNPDQYIFAIRKNGSNFTARVDIYDIPGTTTYSSVGGVGPARGTFLIGRHWDVTVLSGSVTTPVDVRFFVDPAEVLQAETEALALLGSTALPGSTITPLTFFKTPDGVSFNPATMMVNGDFTFTPANTWITPASGTLNGYTYYQLDGITNFSGGTGGFSINDGGAPLPVELLNFTATAMNNEYVQLDWSTATEIDNDGFFVERSTDGSNFTQIAWVDGNGSTTQTQYYTYDDREAVAGVNYYRLKQVDFNGDYEYTYIVSAVLRKDVILLDVLGLRPNPTVNELFVEILAHAETKANFTTFNHMGQKVQTFGKVLEEGQNTVSVNTTDLPAGTYFITIENSQTKITKKFVVIK